jgi:hypothetical protein
MSRNRGYLWVRRTALRKARRKNGTTTRKQRWYGALGGIGGLGGIGFGSAFMLFGIALLALPYLLTMFLTRKMEDQSERKVLAIALTFLFWIIIIGILFVQTLLSSYLDPYS